MAQQVIEREDLSRRNVSTDWYGMAVHYKTVICLGMRCRIDLAREVFRLPDFVEQNRIHLCRRVGRREHELYRRVGILHPIFHRWDQRDAVGKSRFCSSGSQIGGKRSS